MDDITNISGKSLESAMRSYDPDEDIEQNGGLYGMELADRHSQEIEDSSRDEMLEDLEKIIVCKEFVRASTTVTGVGAKRNHLSVYFPMQYGDNGKSPASKMSKERVSRVYGGKLNWARKILNN